MRPQLHEINHLSVSLVAFFLVLDVFLDSHARISLLGEVDCAVPVDKLRSHGAKVAWFGSL